MSKGTVKYFRPKFLAKAQTVFTIIDAKRMQTPHSTVILLFKIRLGNGDEGVVKLVPNQEREKVLEQFAEGLVGRLKFLLDDQGYPQFSHSIIG